MLRSTKTLSREDQALMVKRLIYNDELTEIGCEVRLWWEHSRRYHQEGKERKGKTRTATLLSSVN